MTASPRLRAYEIEFKRQDDGTHTTMTLYAHDADGALRLASAWGRKHRLSVVGPPEEAE